LGNIESEFLGWIIQITGHRNVGDGWLIADKELPSAQSFVDDGKVAVNATFEKREHCRITCRFCEIFQKAKWPKEAVDFLIIENDPAQRFKFFVFVLWFEPAATPGEVSKNHAGLGELFLAVNQHGHLTHFVNFRAKFRCALSHGPKEINPNWRPIRS